MERRSFIRKASMGAAIAPVVAAPAIVHAQPVVRWRCTSSFPKSLDGIYGAAEIVARRVAAMTGDRFRITVHAAGEVVPAGQLLDAVQAGTVEAGHTALSAFYGQGFDQQVIRFCFAKKDDTLQLALQRLARL